MKNHFDYLVIGGGSGGIASANRAGEHGAKVGLIEPDELGGTCVNRGCVPKKVMWYTARLLGNIENHGEGYGLEFPEKPTLNFKKLKDNRDDYIDFLHGAYKRGLDSNNVQVIKGFATFVDNNTVEVNGEEYTADHILIATGGHPSRLNIPGSEYGVDSDGFFELEELPETAAIVGGGYIGVEISGLLRTFGVKTNLYEFLPSVLYNFDSVIKDGYMEIARKEGFANSIFTDRSVTKVNKNGDKYVLIFSDGTTHETDLVIWATGRKPNVENINLNKAGVELDDRGFIKVDKFQNTTAENVYAVGDVIGKINLTPVAIAAGRRLSERLFNGKTDFYLEYKDVPSVVFTEPAIGTVGMTEPEAIKEYGQANIKTYQSQFTSMHSAISENRQKSYMKLVCAGDDEKIVGLHGIGEGMDEILQGFGVAVSMGATKEDFDMTVAIHPTAAEEFVTMR